MCVDPGSLALLSFAVGATQSVLSFVGASQDAKAEREAAIKDNAQTQNQLSLRQLQEQDAAARTKQQQNIEEAQASADVQTSAAAGGVAGISVDNILQDVGRRAAGNRVAATENVKMTIAQLALEKKGSRTRAQGRINQARDPNPLSLVAGLGASALGGYRDYRNLRME
jgi:hypothetical protein